MKTIFLSGGKASNTAIRIMTRHLEGLGHTVVRDANEPWDVTLRWGRSYHGDKPSLNGGVNQFDKYDCFAQLHVEGGIRTPQIISLAEATHLCYNASLTGLPWLARKRQHTKGKDIRVCKTWEDVTDVLDARGGDASHDFFSVFIPTQTEYRVWVFQNKTLGVYEKQYKGEGEYEGFCRNRRFGFSFQKRDDLRDEVAITQPSIGAVKALGMDWGAVDILEGKDGRQYVLEVNSMPHIDSVKRSSGVRLAAAVSKWAEAQ